MTADNKKGQTGWKRVFFLFIFLAITGVITALQLEYHGFQGPLSDYILIILLIFADFLLLTAVIFMMARSLWKLWIEQKKGVLGARFRTKLVTAFVSLSFIPPILLFIIGTGMFTSSIERLFTLRVENALKDSVAVAEEYYSRLQKDALAFGRQISRQMTETRLLGRFENQVVKDYLGKKAEEYGLGSVELFTAPHEQAVTVVTKQYPARTFINTPSDLLSEVFSGQETADVTMLGRRGAVLRAVVPLYESEERKQVTAADRGQLLYSPKPRNKSRGHP